MNKQRNLLVINDEPDMLDQFGRWLSGAGYSVKSTLFGKVGVELASRYPFDLIVLDYNLKQEKGGEKTAKSFIPQFIKINPFTPIIVVSATARYLSANDLGVSAVLIVDRTFWKRLLIWVKKVLINERLSETERLSI